MKSQGISFNELQMLNVGSLIFYCWQTEDIENRRFQATFFWKLQHFLIVSSAFSQLYYLLADENIGVCAKIPSWPSSWIGKGDNEQMLMGSWKNKFREFIAKTSARFISILQLWPKFGDTKFFRTFKCIKIQAEHDQEHWSWIRVVMQWCTTIILD